MSSLIGSNLIWLLREKRLLRGNVTAIQGEVVDGEWRHGGSLIQPRERFERNPRQE